MSVEFELNAKTREDLGKGASRRLRREGWIPAIMYGGNKQPEPLMVEQREILKSLRDDGFYSHILNIKIGSRTERAILKDIQRHPYKPVVSHLDLQRVSAEDKIRVHVPVHFLNEKGSKGIRQGGVISHHLIDIEITCLPKDLIESIDVDIANMEIGDALHLSELKLPEGVEIVQLHGEEGDTAVVSIHHPQAGTTAEDDEAEDAEGDTE